MRRTNNHGKGAKQQIGCLIKLIKIARGLEDHNVASIECKVRRLTNIIGYPYQFSFVTGFLIYSMKKIKHSVIS